MGKGGPTRLFWELFMIEEYDKMKANGKLPQQLHAANLEEEKEAAAKKKPDCIQHFTRMRGEYEELAAAPERDHPPSLKEIPHPREQKIIILDKMKNQKENLI